MAGILMMFLDVSLLRLPLTSAESQKQALTKRLGAQALQATTPQHHSISRALLFLARTAGQ